MCFRYPFDVYKCGKCPECLQDKRREWSIRLQLHAFFSDSVPFFAHLTYDNEHVPVNVAGKLTLCKRDVQLFLKRLRANLKSLYEKGKIKDYKSIKYYCAGEYGPNGTHRPHYHILLFGLPQTLQEDEVKKIISQAWLNGDVRQRSCWLKDYAQIHYCTKYMINYFDEDFSDKVAPFRMVSAGIGRNFIDYAIKNNLYDINVQKLFKCDVRVSNLNNHRIPIRWKLEQPLLYDSDGTYRINPLLENFRDFIEFQSFVKGVPKVYRFPLPRYFAERLYTDDFRMALAVVKKYKLQCKNNDYHSEYLIYDRDTTAMWLQLKNYLWQKKKKTKKDKNLRVNINDILND